MLLVARTGSTKPASRLREEWAMSKGEMDGKKVLIVGLGLTGKAAAEFAIKQGANVTVTDRQTDGTVARTAEALSKKGVKAELGTHEEKSFTGADLILLSPGVPPTLPGLVKAREKGVEVTGEIELASRYLKAPMAAVTGTNGKTTTTELLGMILLADGKKIFVGGNIGNPLISLAGGRKKVDAAVVEVSSFQLETAESLHPQVAALLNVTPDHMDRYASINEYIEAKARLFARQDENDVAVMNADDPIVARIPVPSRRLEFSRTKKLINGAYIDGKRIILADCGKRVASLKLDDLQLVGGHNHENVMAALLMAWAMGVSPETACRAALDFKGLPHRVELVAKLKKVRYYNDSKGTNVDAVIRSLESFDRPIILIAGGRDKDGDFRPWRPILKERVKMLILMGEAGYKMALTLGRWTRTVLVADLNDAVSLARERARPGDVVLLSPGCASFDMFRNYEHRGEVFTQLVKEAK